MEGEKEKEEENTLVGPTWWNERHQKYCNNYGGHAKFQRSVWPSREEVSALLPSRHPSLPPSPHLEGPLLPERAAAGTPASTMLTWAFCLAVSDMAQIWMLQWHPFNYCACKQQLGDLHTRHLCLRFSARTGR